MDSLFSSPPTNPFPFQPFPSFDNTLRPLFIDPFKLPPTPSPSPKDLKRDQPICPRSPLPPPLPLRWKARDHAGEARRAVAQGSTLSHKAPWTSVPPAEGGQAAREGPTALPPSRASPRPSPLGLTARSTLRTAPSLPPKSPLRPRRPTLRVDTGTFSSYPFPSTDSPVEGATIGLGLRIQLDDLRVSRSFLAVDAEACLAGDRSLGTSRSSSSSFYAPDRDEEEGDEAEERDPFHLRRLLRLSVATGQTSDPLTGSTSEDVLIEEDEPLWREVEVVEAEREDGFDADKASGVVDWRGLHVDKCSLPSTATHLLLAHSSSPPSTLADVIFVSTNSLRHSLTVLDISFCGFTVLPDALVELTSLVELDISGNSLSLLPATLAALSSLRVFVADSCNLASPSSFPSELVALRQLDTLSIRNNSLKILPSWLCRLDALEVLLVDGNVFHPQLATVVAPLYEADAKQIAEASIPGTAEFLRTQLACDSLFPPDPHETYLFRHTDDPKTVSGRFSGLSTHHAAALRCLLAYLRDLDDLTFPAAFVAPAPLPCPPSPATSATFHRFTPVAVTAAPSQHNRSQSAFTAPTTPTSPSSRSLFASSCARPALRRVYTNLDVRRLDHTVEIPPLPFSPSHSSLPSFTPITPFGPLADAPISTSSPRDDPVRRAALLREFVSTEATYVRQLSELCSIYVSSASSSPSSPVFSFTSSAGAPVLSEQERRAVFANVAAIRELHAKVVLPELIKAAELRDEDGASEGERSRKAADRVAEVLVSLAGAMKIYSSYLSTFDAAHALLASWSKKPSSRPTTTGSMISSPRPLEPTPSRFVQTDAINMDAPYDPARSKRVRAWLKRCRSHPSHSQISLQAYLLLPIQRIPRYRLLLTALSSCTPPPPASPRFPFPSLLPLERAAQEVHALACYLNEGKREEEGRRELLRWERRGIVREEVGEDGVEVMRRVTIAKTGRRVVKIGEVVLSRAVKLRPLPNSTPDEPLFALTHSAKKEQLIALLCTDILLLLRPRPATPATTPSPTLHRRSFSSTSLRQLATSQPAQRAYELVASVKLDGTVSLGAGEAGPASVFGEDGMLRLNTPTQILYLRCPTSPSSPPSSPLRAPISPTASFSSLFPPPLSSSLSKAEVQEENPRAQAVRAASEWQEAVNGRWRAESEREGEAACSTSVPE